MRSYSNSYLSALQLIVVYNLHMIIGIDASHLNPSNMSGTQVYLHSLLQHISLIDNKNIYYVYTKYPISKEFFAEMVSYSLNFRCVNLPKYLSWTQVSLAARTFKDNLDVLFCPWQTMPMIHSRKTKVVAVLHGMEYSFLRFGPTYYTALFSDAVICVSNFTRDQLRTKIPFLKKEIHIVYEGIDTKRFRKLSVSDVAQVLHKYQISSPYVFFIGYMVARKNIERLLHAYAKYMSLTNTPVKLVLGGSVPNESSYLLDLPRKLGVEHQVQFIGYVPADDLPSLLSGASALAYVSLSEGFGLPPLEAMACQTPVLASNAGALPEVCGDAALLVDPKHVDEINTGLARILTDAELRDALVFRGLENIKKFDWQVTAKKILDILIAQET